MSNGTLTDEKQGEDYQDYGMRHPPRISDWTLEDKILWTDLRRAAFEYAYMHRYFTADWDSGSPRQPGAPDRWRYDPEAANEAGRVTATGWDWKVPQAPAAPPADMSQLEEMKQILDQDRSPPSTVWDPRFDQETAYADANTYLAENIPGFTLELLDRLCVHAHRLSTGIRTCRPHALAGE